MKRKILSVVFVLASVCLLASCSGKIDAVTDNNGRQYTIKRDGNGFAKTDDKGNLIVYETDENGKIKQNAEGEDVTSVVDFPNYIANDKTVECEYFSLAIPDGWQVQNGHTVKLFKEDSQAEISFTLRSTNSVDDCINQVKDLFSDWDFKWKETEQQFDFATAKVISSDKIIENYEKSYYVFAIDDTTYVVSTSFNKKLADSVDFASVIGSIAFK